MPPRSYPAMSSRRPPPFSPHFYLILILSVLAFAATTDAQNLKGLPTLGAATPTADTSSAKQTSGSSSHSQTSPPSPSIPQSATTTANLPSFGGLTNAPSIYGAGVPPLIVPDTGDAPFMQKSDLPEGTVFICVGAALGFLGMSVLAWRGLVAWSLHRSVRRAATAKYASEKKSMYSGTAPTGYSNMYHSASVSLEQLAVTNTAYNSASGQRHSKSSKPPKRNSMQAPTNSSLFFSPTAGQSPGGANRTSSYLPAGFYASGASMPASGSAIAQLGGPPAAGYGRVDSYSNSPPATPGHQGRPESADSPVNHGHTGSRGRDLQDARMSLSVPRQRSEQRRSGGSREGNPSGQRAPSAVLDELFEHHTGMRERD